MEMLNEKIKISWRWGWYFFVVMMSVGIFVPIYLASENLFYSIIPLLVIIPFTEWMIRLTYNNFKYELTKDSLKIEKGVIVKVYKSIPYSRIQNIDIKRGIMARILGYSSVSIHTAGYSAAGQYYMPEGYLPGVSVKEAERIREFVLKRVK